MTRAWEHGLSEKEYSAMGLTKKIASAQASADFWRAGFASWQAMQETLVGLGFYRILRGSKPRQVYAYLDGVLYEL